jgi:hypothetical protein
VQVLVNGVAKTGAQSKSHLVKNASGDNQSSGSLVYLLRNLAVNDVISLQTIALGAAGTLIADQNALLMLWRKAAQSTYIQDTERWYANVDAQTPTDPWPTGAVDVSTRRCDNIRQLGKKRRCFTLRMAVQTNATTASKGDSFKLQYAAGSTCSAALAWTDVGATVAARSGAAHDNASVSDGHRLSRLLLSVSSTSETYEENNPSAGTPNAITANKDGEWDWAIEDNGATVGTDYCFRMVNSTGQVLKDYNDYPAARDQQLSHRPDASNAVRQ